MKHLWFALLFVCTVACGQVPQATPTPPFRLNVRVAYSGEKTHPDIASFIYSSLRELPGVGVVDQEPDAILVINEMAHGNQYGCTFTVLVPASADVQSTVSSALSMYDGEQKAKGYAANPPVYDEPDKPFWRVWLPDSIKKMQPIYHYGGSWIMLEATPRVALSAAIKTFETTYLEKQRREYDYTLAHPVTLEPFHSPLATKPTLQSR